MRCCVHIQTYALQLAWLVAIRAINPGLAHWRVVKRILRYLRGTIDHALCYHSEDLRLTGYSDADWASGKDERKSTSGFAFILGGGAISWCSKKSHALHSLPWSQNMWLVQQLSRKLFG
jgi:hypothetical protein